MFNLQAIQNAVAALSPAAALQWIAEQYGKNAVFTTSFGVEDQVITHFIADQKLPITIATLDTGRLFYETYTTWNNTLSRYNIAIDSYVPDATALATFITKEGPNSFYKSQELRKNCCYIRKVLPLQQLLNNKKIWITGIRAAQSSDRQTMEKIEWDEANQIIKFHPLLDWSIDNVLDTIRTYNIPYNPLQDKGFVSIGCAPCTRAIRQGEDFRAGRWWWEDNTKKECGLHAHSPNAEKPILNPN